MEEVFSCCICLKSAPVLYKITEKVNDDETLTPIYKLLICVPDINWLQFHQICNLCKDNLHETYDFREMCFKSEFLRCEIKIEDHKVEILNDDDFDDDLKIEPKSPVENTRVSNVCNICSKFRESLSKIGENANAENVSPIHKLQVLMRNINWSDDFTICNLCKEKLYIAYDFRELCFKNQISNLVIENKQIKLETIDNEDVEIENSESPKLLDDICKYCECIFDSKQQLIVHLQSEHLTNPKRSPKIFNCKHCNKEYKSKRTLQRHSAKMHKVGINEIIEFKCEHCRKEFTMKKTFRRHLIKIHKVGVEEILKHECHVCTKRFLSPKDLKRHSDLVHLNIYECEQCDKEYKSKCMLQRHLATIHNLENINICHKCEQCGKEFTNKSGLDMHLASVHQVEVEETRIYECDHCSKRFSLALALKRHLRLVHSNISDFECKQCNKQFKSKGMLKIHLAIIHKVGIEETLRQQCHLCSERYISPIDLQKHLSSTHEVGVNEILKHECQLCSKRFVTPHALKIHLDVHLNACDFLCEKCGKKFKKMRYLRVHMIKMHQVGAIEETLKLECNFCSKPFSSSSDLRNHLREVHLNISDFKCEQCDMEFKKKQCFQLHLARVHQAGVEETLKYECRICLKQFLTPSKLKRHLCMCV